MFKKLITISITVGALVSLGIFAYKFYKFDDGSNGDSSKNNDGDNKNNSRNNNDSNNNNQCSNNNDNSNDNSNSSNNNNNNHSDEEVEKESINKLSEESVEKDQLEQQIVSTVVEAQEPSEPTQIEPEKPSEPQAVEAEQSLVPQQQLVIQSLKPEQSLAPQQQLEVPQPKPEPQSEPEQHQMNQEDQAQQSWDVLFEKVKRREWIKSETKKLEESLSDPSKLKGSSIHLSDDDKLRIRLFKQFPLFTRGLIQDLDDWEVKNNNKFIWEGTPYMDIITEESTNLNFKLLDLVYSFRDIK